MQLLNNDAVNGLDNSVSHMCAIVESVDNNAGVTEAEVQCNSVPYSSQSCVEDGENVSDTKHAIEHELIVSDNKVPALSQSLVEDSDSLTETEPASECEHSVPPKMCQLCLNLILKAVKVEVTLNI